MGIKIIGAGHYLPEKIVNNVDFERFIETSNEWIVKRTGIENRHISCGEFTVQMACKAVDEALKRANISANDLDLIIGSTVTSDFAFPSMSNMVQGYFNAVNAFTIDISCACAGFIYALDMAQRYINSGDEIKNVLIVCSENMTKMVDFSDRSTCVLFGDGAGAVIVQKSENEAFSVLKTDGTHANLIYANLRSPNNVFTTKSEIEFQKGEFEAKFFKNSLNPFVEMDGGKVYKLAVENMAKVLIEVCEKAKIAVSDLAYVVPHQANSRIIEKVAQRIGVCKEKIYINIKNTGNISSACVPVCLSQMFQQNKLKKGDKIGLVGFGSGLTYGALIASV